MSPPSEPDEILGPTEIGPVRLPSADPDNEAIAYAAAELRRRTMELEPEEPMPGKRIIVAILVATACVAVALILLRQEVRGMLGLG